MSGHVLLLVLPLIPFVALIVFSSHRMSKRYLPQVMNEVGWRGSVSYTHLDVYKRQLLVQLDSFRHQHGRLHVR